MRSTLCVVVLGTCCIATHAWAADDLHDPAGALSLWNVLRIVEGDAEAVIQLRRETFDLIMRAPALISNSRIPAILPEDSFRWRRQEEDRGGMGALWSVGLDSVLSGSVEMLGDIVSHGRWSIVRPQERDSAVSTFEPANMQAQLAIPLGLELPVEARFGIETDSIREDYFVFSTELGTSNGIAAKWLAWSTRLDYRSNLEAPASARAEQRVGIRLGGKDTVGVSGRIEDRNLAMAASPLIDLAPAGEVFWNHRWLGGIESSLRLQQVLPDLQSLWLSDPASSVQVEANLRASLNPAARVDLRGTTTQDLNQVGIRLQFEFLLGTPVPQPPERIMLPERAEENDHQEQTPFAGILR